MSVQLTCALSSIPLEYCAPYGVNDLSGLPDGETTASYRQVNNKSKSGQ